MAIIQTTENGMKGLIPNLHRVDDWLLVLHGRISRGFLKAVEVSTNYLGHLIECTIGTIGTTTA